MIRRPPRSTRTDTLFPYTTLFRSHLTLGAEPESVVDKLGIAWGKLVLQVRRTPVQRELLDSAMRGVEDGPARRLVHAARFLPDAAVFHQVQPAVAMRAAKVVQPGEQAGGRSEACRVGHVCLSPCRYMWTPDH